MKDSLRAFESLLEDPCVKKANVVLMFTKVDLFTAKLAVHPLQEDFVDFDVPVGNATTRFERALLFIIQKFLDVNKDPNRYIAVHSANATKRSTIKKCLRNIVDGEYERIRLTPDKPFDTEPGSEWGSCCEADRLLIE